jgi:hypothetical protein
MDYAELGPMFYGSGTIDWALPPGKWIAFLRGEGFIVERLEELIPPVELTTTREDFAPSEWAHRWPAQWIWVARRQ